MGVVMFLGEQVLLQGDGLDFEKKTMEMRSGENMG